MYRYTNVIEMRRDIIKRISFEWNITAFNEHSCTLNQAFDFKTLTVILF